MKLNELLKGVPVLEMTADPAAEITNVVYDTRKEILPGSLFIAIRGFSFDGNSYIPTALGKGACAVVTARRPDTDIPYILVESDRLALALIGANWYGEPARSMTMIGITGTNGKTSSTLLLKHILEKTLGAKVGLIGTMSNLIGDEEIPTERTTPESFELQGLFARMRDAGCSHVIMEVSSHALSLDRVGGVFYDVAAFTNLTEDHLDFHKTMESYCDAKALLFGRCGRAVINRDDPWAERIRAGARCPVLYTSLQPGEGLYAEAVQMLSDGISFAAVSGSLRAEVKLGIPGRFTVYNAMTALGIALQLGLPLEQAARALETAEGVKGRVEVVPTPGMPFTVLIDYAHTPDGLENVLTSVRGFCRGRLIAVFGCGGDRDPIKRPIMGRIGAELADIAIVTSDNPRTEKPGKIIEDILAGIEREKNTCIVIENRREAIHHAMDIGQKHDIIVLAGKGHETDQEINGVKYPMDERQIVAEHLREMRETHG